MILMIMKIMKIMKIIVNKAKLIPLKLDELNFDPPLFFNMFPSAPKRPSDGIWC